MTSKALDQSLRALARRTPFQPFTVELVSGSTFRVEHPEALAFRGGIAVFIGPDGGFSLFDHEGVARVNDLGSPARKGKPNGHG